MVTKKVVERSARVSRALKMRNILNVLKLNPSEPIKDSGRLGLLHGALATVLLPNNIKRPFSAISV